MRTTLWLPAGFSHGPTTFLILTDPPPTAQEDPVAAETALHPTAGPVRVELPVQVPRQPAGLVQQNAVADG